MITTFCLLFKVKICFQLFFRLPCCAIDSLKHWFIFISSPVSSSNRFKFNSIPVYISSRINMWSSTKVPPFITCKKCVKFDVKTSKSIWGIWRDQIGWYQCKLRNLRRYRFFTVCLKTRRKLTHKILQIDQIAVYIIYSDTSTENFSQMGRGKWWTSKSSHFPQNMNHPLEYSDQPPRMYNTIIHPLS